MAASDGGILRLRAPEVVANRIHRARARRSVVSSRTSASSTPCEKFERRFGAARCRRRRHAKAVAELVAALIQVHEPEHGLAQQLAGELQRGVARLGGDGARIDARAAAKRGEPQIEVALVERRVGALAERRRPERRPQRGRRLPRFALTLSGRVIMCQGVPDASRRRDAARVAVRRSRTGRRHCADELRCPRPVDRWARAAGSDRDPRPGRWRWIS